jgi:hypothetical protein
MQIGVGRECLSMFYLGGETCRPVDKEEVETNIQEAGDSVGEGTVDKLNLLLEVCSFTVFHSFSFWRFFISVMFLNKQFVCISYASCQLFHPNLLPNIDVQWFGISEYRSRRRED